MQDERDIVVFTDDEGNEIELEVMDYFFCEGKEYAVLTDVVYDEDEEDGCDCCCDHDEDCDCEDCDCDCEDVMDMYIMQVVQLEGDMEEFIPVEDEKLMDQLIAIAEKRFDEDFDDEEEEDEE